ncbi:Rv3654c family TadE-like protein [Nocardia sp. NPDC047654]|uniref:Rv3654c family TadE-like protein n=1 Tax=Nocardia sp. NPDC047654 TaxID=3364314 RepID=UPI00371DA760
MTDLSDPEKHVQTSDRFAHRMGSAAWLHAYPLDGGVAGPTWREASVARSSRRASSEDGLATVFTCLALVGLIGVTLLIAQVGTVVVERHRAQAAADSAALAGAGALVAGVEAACAEADEAARRMGTRIRVCEVAEWDLTVAVERNVPIGLYGDRVVRASARAGPVEG